MGVRNYRKGFLTFQLENTTSGKNLLFSRTFKTHTNTSLDFLPEIYMVKTVVKTSNPGLWKLIFVVYKKFLHLNICFEAPSVYSKKIKWTLWFWFHVNNYNVKTIITGATRILSYFRYFHISHKRKINNFSNFHKIMTRL